MRDAMLHDDFAVHVEDQVRGSLIVGEGDVVPAWRAGAGGGNASDRFQRRVTAAPVGGNQGGPNGSIRGDVGMELEGQRGASVLVKENLLRAVGHPTEKSFDGEGVVELVADVGLRKRGCPIKPQRNSRSQRGYLHAHRPEARGQVKVRIIPIDRVNGNKPEIVVAARTRASQLQKRVAIPGGVEVTIQLGMPIGFLELLQFCAIGGRDRDT